MKKFRKVQPAGREAFSPREAVEMQLHLEEVFRDIQDQDILDGVLLEDVSFTAGSINHVEHGLGRPAKYAILTSDAQLILYEDNSDGMDQDTYLSLVPSTTCTATLWVCSRE